MSAVRRFFAAAFAVARKDFQVEVRSRELVAVMVLFSLLSVVVFSFALELNRQARAESIGGVLWVTVTFAAILGLNRAMAVEREGGSFDALLLAPAPRAALYIGKLISVYAFILAVALPLLLIMTLLYNVAVITLAVVGVVLAGAFSLAAIGTLLAAMTVQTRSREALLPIVMLPIVLPALLAAVRATNGILGGADPESWGGWVNILLTLDGVYLALCLLAFPFVIEE
jgi:heme exporter protein B